MVILNKITLGVRIMLGFGLIILFLAFILNSGYTTINSLETSKKNLYEKEFSNAVGLKDIRSNQNANRANMLAMMLEEDTAKLQKFEEDIEIRTRENNENLVMLMNKNRDYPDILQKLEKFQAVLTLFIHVRTTQLIPLIRAGRTDEARTLFRDEQSERDRQLSEITDELVTAAESAAEKAVMESTLQAEEAIRIFTLTGIVIIFISVVMGVHINFIVRKISREIREGTNVLASAASEIVATTTQVASGAAETATAVSETGTTVEEVKKTAELSSDKARYVSETAQKAMQVSQTGKQAVEQSIDGVNQVRQQMEVLAESIVRLSERGQAIGEVIATVNDLAEQSNLLAVNAAIEAAKAGEQGKGFGVVAQEIRSLAEQSKQATSQVRTILGDIQKATSASVLAAEQGSKAVESGVKQSMEAGEAIKMLAQSIAEAAQAATQIAASSRQQQVGMDQVAQAMDNIQQATSQNMAGTKQAETAAHNLSELGQKLKVIIEQFRV